VKDRSRSGKTGKNDIVFCQTLSFNIILVDGEFTCFDKEELLLLITLSVDAGVLQKNAPVRLFQGLPVHLMYDLFSWILSLPVSTSRSEHSAPGYRYLFSNYY
jgi:hypothetical protein